MTKQVQECVEVLMMGISPFEYRQRFNYNLGTTICPQALRLSLYSLIVPAQLNKC